MTRDDILTVKTGIQAAHGPRGLREVKNHQLRRAATYVAVSGITTAESVLAGNRGVAYDTIPKFLEDDPRLRAVERRLGDGATRATLLEMFDVATTVPLRSGMPGALAQYRAAITGIATKSEYQNLNPDTDLERILHMQEELSEERTPMSARLAESTHEALLDAQRGGIEIGEERFAVSEAATTHQIKTFATNVSRWQVDMSYFPRSG